MRLRLVGETLLTYREPPAIPYYYRSMGKERISMTIVNYDIIRTTCRFKNTESGDVVNVYHYMAGPGVSESDEDVMDAIETQLSAQYAEIATRLSNDNVPYDVRHDVVVWEYGKETVERTMGTRTWTLTNPPSSSGESLPQMDAAIVNFRTLLPKTFGRKYLPPMGEETQAGGIMGSATLTAVAAFAAECLLSITMTSGSLVPGVVSYKETLYDHFESIIAAVVSDVLGSQRRRRIRRGS